MSRMNKDALLNNISQIRFMCIELNLYLDTHPNDTRALMQYNYYSQQLKMLVQMYEQMYGPLKNFGGSQSHGRWRWIDSPWPWENDDNQEVEC